MSSVVLLSEVGSHGGIPRFNRLLIEALGRRATARGRPLRVLSLNDDHDLVVGDVPVEGFGRRKAAFASASALALRGEVNLVLSGHVNLAPLAESVRFATRRRFVHGVIAHGIEVWGEIDRPRTLALQRADFVTAVSDYTRRQLTEFHGIPRDRIDLLPNALPTSFAHLEVTGTVVPGRVMSCSRLEPYERYKGIEHLIRALPALRVERPEAHLVVIGDGSERQRLEGLASDLGVRAHVRFAGSVPDDELKRQYAQCEVFAMPSRKEGFGIVYLEAMAFGKPCLAARAGGAPEVVLHGKTGVIVEYGDVPGITQYLAWLLRDRERARQLGAAGRRRLEDVFTSEGFVRRVDEIADARLSSPPVAAPPAASERVPA